MLRSTHREKRRTRAGAGARARKRFLLLLLLLLLLFFLLAVGAAGKEEGEKARGYWLLSLSPLYRGVVAYSTSRAGIPRQRSRPGEFALHRQRERVEFGVGFQRRVVEHHGPRANSTCGADLHGGHFHHAILEQMRLQRRVSADRGVVANHDQVELGQIRCLDVNTPADVDAEQAQQRRDQRRAGQPVQYPGHRHVFVQAGDELGPPDEVRPHRRDPRAIAAHDEPLERRRHQVRAGPRKSRPTAPSASAAARRVRRPVPESPGRGETWTAAPTATARAGTRSPAGKPPDAGGRNVTIRRTSRWPGGAAGRSPATRATPNRPRPFRAARESTPIRQLCGNRVLLGTSAALPTKPRAPTSVMPSAMKPWWTGGANHRQVGHETLGPQREQVRVDVRHRRDFRAVRSWLPAAAATGSM